MANHRDLHKLGAEVQDLRAQLEKSEASLREILCGESDALFVSGEGGAQVFTLKGADQSYRTLIENMSEGALTLTPAGLILYANRRFAEMLRTPLEKVIGSDIHPWIAPESQEVLQTLLRKDTLDNGREELALAAADGTQVPVYLSVSRLRLDAMPDSFCMIATDLTEQKRNEAFLADEALKQAILDQAADAIVICDETGRILRASKHAQALCGNNPIGQHFEHAFPLLDLAGTVFPPVGAIDTSGRPSVEARLEHDGQVFDLLVSIGHLRGARNALLGSVVTLTDITERKHAELRLLESERRFTDLLENVELISVMRDRDQRITYCNDYLLLLTGWRKEDVIGRDWNELFVPPDMANEKKEIYAALLLNKPDAWHYESKILTRSGEPRLIRWNNTVLRSGTGDVIGTASIGEDITEQKRSEISIKRLNRVYAVLSGINGLIVRVHDRDELFREACRIAVEAGGFRMALIGIVDRSAMRIIPVGTAGMDDEFLTVIKDRFLLDGDTSLENTIPAQVIREKRLIVVNDVQLNPEIVFGRKYAESGIRSMVVFPLVVMDEAVGMLMLYASEAAFFQEDELKLLTELSGDIAFAIDHLAKQERLDYLAYYDVLTGLANRSLFRDRVALYIRSAVSSGHKLALFLIDLERFKNVNDSLGRSAGDMLLRQVADWLKLDAGDASLVARLDADHFATVLPVIKQEGNEAQFVEKKIDAFMHHPFRLDDAVLRVAFKVGIAVFPDDGADADTLFRKAEAALKKAKASGERYLFYTKAMTEGVEGTLTLENQLRQALDNEEFVLYYQPKVNLANGKLTSAEALIRWNDPRTGLVQPGRFIPILEETGMIHEVGRWALRQAIADYLRWRKAGLPAVRIAVNVSALQLRNRGFIEEIRQTIGVDAQAAAGLELEITESLIMEDVKGTIASLQALRDLGVTIAIDDFGTGFSSLAYLARLPVDTLKIDRSFIINMTAAPEGLALVSTIINLAHSLKLKVVAEGVDTEEQSRLLRLLACDEIQGFLFSKPVPGEIFEAKFLVPACGT